MVTGCDAPKLLELTEESLDAIALLIEVRVVGPPVCAVSPWRDDDLGPCGRDPLRQVVCVIALVCDRDLGRETVDQLMGECDVVALSGGADQAQWQAKGLGGGMDLGAQPAPRPVQALGIRPPFTLRAPAAC